jgi:hypothetical protein
MALCPRKFADGGKTCTFKELKTCQYTHFSQYNEALDSYKLRKVFNVYNIHELTPALVIY